MILPRNETGGPRRARFSVLLCLLFCAAFAAGAQSGRRAPAVKSPSPVETPAPPPAPTPTPAAASPQYSLRIVSHNPETVYTLITFPERVAKWIGARLGQSPLLAVESTVSGTMKEAREMAKNSKESYVVLIEVDENWGSLPPNGGTRASDGEVWIDFYVLSPGDGKIKTQGRAALKPELLSRTGRITGNRRCAPVSTNEDLLLWEASQEAAERIIAGFNLPVPPLRCDATFFALAAAAGDVGAVGPAKLFPEKFEP